MSPNLFKQNLFEKSFVRNSFQKYICIFLPYLEKLSLLPRSTLKNLSMAFFLVSIYKWFPKSRKDWILYLPSMTKYPKKCIPYFVTNFSIYYGKTKRHFKVRVSEQTGVSARTGKNIKSTKNYAVGDHVLVCDDIVSFEEHLKKHLTIPIFFFIRKQHSEFPFF